MLKLVFLGLVATAFGQAPAGPNVPCGVPVVQPIQSKIVGGVSANPGSWPWMIMLTDDQDFVAGSAAIIHPHVLLTSAQLFQGSGYSLADQNLPAWTIYAGAYNVSTTAPFEKTYSIQRVILHENYDVSTLENDIALIIVREAITWNDHTRPACIVDQGHSVTKGEMCILPGWGSTSNTGSEESMNQVTMPILDDSVCKTHWSDFLPNAEICAGYENGGKDFCEDDIGSPLMCKETNGAWVVHGLASSGGDCTQANEPGIFEDVSQYSDWVKNTMKTAGYNYAY